MSPSLITHWQLRRQSSRVVAYFSLSDVMKMYADVPSLVWTDWRYSGPAEFERMHISIHHQIASFIGLMVYFLMVKKAGCQTMLPSRAADSLWHAWLRASPMTLASFQSKYFGSTIQHLEENRVLSQGHSTHDALANTWRFARGTEKCGPTNIPYLFELDHCLNFYSGWSYRYAEGAIQMAVIEDDLRYHIMSHLRVNESIL